MHLGEWSVLGGMVRTAEETARQAARLRLATPDRMGPGIVATADQLAPLVSLLLYLCSDGADITDPSRPGRRPGRPRPTKTKRGWRIFPPN